MRPRSSEVGRWQIHTDGVIAALAVEKDVEQAADVGGVHHHRAPVRPELRAEDREAVRPRVPAFVDRALLVRAVDYADELKMPPKGKLSSDQIASSAALRIWPV